MNTHGIQGGEHTLTDMETLEDTKTSQMGNTLSTHPGTRVSFKDKYKRLLSAEKEKGLINLPTKDDKKDEDTMNF